MKKESGKFFNPHRLALATIATLGLGVAACDSSNGEEIPTDRSTSGENLPTEISPRRYIDLPFSPNSEMNIQQAWSGFELTHHAMDIVKGDLDNSSTWESFPVLAGADGKACANPNDKQGKAVLIDHGTIEQGTLYEYSGHLSSIPEEILKTPCSGKKRTEVKRGQEIGKAGATGVIYDGKEQPTWTHLHWALFVMNGKQRTDIDAFDIRGARELYPNIDDPKFTNGKLCGPQTILIDCPTEAYETPTFTLEPTPILTPHIKPTPEKNTPTATKSTPEATKQKTPTPTKNKTPEATQNNWQVYTSPFYNYQWEIPIDWNSSFAVGIGTILTFEQFFDSSQILGGFNYFEFEKEPSFDMNSYINQVLEEETGFEGGLINPLGPAPADEPDPEGLMKIANATFMEQNVTMLFMRSDPYHAPYFQNRIFVETENKIIDIALRYSAENSKDDVQRIHEILLHAMSTYKFPANSSN